MPRRATGPPIASNDVSEPQGPVRKAFHEELADIDDKIRQLFALVAEMLAAATDSFLAGDRSAAREVAGRDELIDALEREVEEVVERNLLFQAPVASEFHHLIAALRIVPELERSGDLAEHIASRAARGLGMELTPVVRGLVEQLGQASVSIWKAAAHCYDAPEPGAADRLEVMDDEIDDLHERLWAALAESELPNNVAMEMALVARFYERLGDHATHITARLDRLRR